MRVTRTDLDPVSATVRTTRRRMARAQHQQSVDRALRLIDELPRVRVHLVEAAIARLAAGRRPSSEAIADMAIRRAGCDRPR
jgi:hypothetical protein